jgi:hypothetical protein
MNLFDMSGNDVKIHVDMLAIPEFKKVWDSNENKDHAFRILSYVILNNHALSYYVKTYSVNDRKALLRKDFLEGVEVSDEDLAVTENAFLAFHDTLLIKLLRKLRGIVEDFIEDLDAGKIGLKEAVELGPKAEKLIKSILDLEESVKLEMNKKSSVKGGYKLGILEQGRKW